MDSSIPICEDWMMIIHTLFIPGLQGYEWIIILAVVLLFFGGKKLPELARSLGRAKKEFAKGQLEEEEEVQEKKEKASEGEASSVAKAAKALGISTEGKTEKQLRDEIEKALKGG